MKLGADIDGDGLSGSVVSLNNSGNTVAILSGKGEVGVYNINLALVAVATAVASGDVTNVKTIITNAVASRINQDDSVVEADSKQKTLDAILVALQTLTNVVASSIIDDPALE